MLGRYPNVQAAVQGVAGLDKLAAEPIKVFVNEYSQTPESVADIVGTVKDAKALKQLAATTIPNGLLIGGIVLAVAGLLLALWPSGSHGPAATASAVDAAAGTSRRRCGWRPARRDHRGPTGPVAPP